MRLSELKTGEKGVVVKVLGHGGFRKRIVEMGFIKGKVVEVLLAAPLRDPVKYRLMGYEISLRRSEAKMIEVISTEEAQLLATEEHPDVTLPSNQGLVGETVELNDEELKRLALRQRRTINVAFVGNPNSGKTSIFNIASGAHEHVGNYSGVTVDAKDGHFDFEGYHFNIVDLPGTYSLSCYSPEELYVREQIIEKTPDIIINVVDASNLERNLYLTTQLIDMNLRTVVALNMYDELEASGNKLDYKMLGQLFGVPMVPTVGRTGKGIDLLFHIIINLYEGADFIGKDGKINEEVFEELQHWHKQYHSDDKEEHEEDFASDVVPKNNVFHHIHINHGHDIEEGIEAIKEKLAVNEGLRSKYSLRYLSIKLLEKDNDMNKMVARLPNGSEILATRDQESERIQQVLHEDSETAIMNAKYGFISGALKETFVDMHKKDVRQVTKWIDSIVTNRFMGFPIFFVLMFLMFEITFVIGQYPMDWIEAGVAWLGDFINEHMSEGPLRDMIVDGAIGGVGAVIVFLPQILILYFFISLMEESGYMARAAFIMDKLMHGMGLHGKSFIPLIMGFGCNVPAEMSTRTIESPKSRLVTMLVLPLMSCSARLPIYLIIVGVFFAQYKALVILLLYAIGIFLAVIMARIFSAFLVKGDNTPFVMELPPYRYPTAKAILRHTWEKGRQYLYKMGHIILVASVIVWFLGYYPNHYDYASDAEQQENSYLGHIGKAIEPVLAPCGFDWKMDVGLLAGAGAKELVASTMGVLYSNNAEAKSADLSDNIRAAGITPLSAFAYLLFVLIYFPCIATITAIKNESGSWKWALFTAGYTTALAWFVSMLVYQVGGLFL